MHFERYNESSNSNVEKLFICSNWKSVRKGGPEKFRTWMCSAGILRGDPESLRTWMCRCSAGRSRRLTCVNLQCSAGRSRRFTYVNVQVFCGKISKVYVRECAGVLREDSEGLHTWMCRCSAGRSRRTCTRMSWSRFSRSGARSGTWGSWWTPCLAWTGSCL